MRSKASTNAQAMQIVSNAILTVSDEEWTDGRRGNEQFGISVAKFLVDRRGLKETYHGKHQQTEEKRMGKCGKFGKDQNLSP